MTVTLSARHLVKRYGGVVALADGNLDVQGGDVLALMGANGSGKSTLSKIITGVVAPDEGQIVLDGHEVRIGSPQAARRHGIAAVYQELSLVPDMTVEENIWLAHEPLGALRQVRTRVVRERTLHLLQLFAGTVGPSLRPDALVRELPPDERQIVEILKALSLEPRIMILDEATASLDSRQVGHLLDLVAAWKAAGKAIIFVSHRMEEVFRVAERAIILRSGRTVATAALNHASRQELVKLMVEGGTVEHIARADAAAPVSNALEEAMLWVEGLRAGRVRGVDLALHAGELLGLGGLQGQGQADLLLALFGALPSSAVMRLEGRPMQFRGPRDAMRAGIAFVPGDRSAEGLLPVRSILENLHLPSWRRYGNLLRMSAAHAEAEAMGRSLNLLMESLSAPVSSLSGGNAQKVVLGKWLLRKPRVLLLNDPTKGVDVAAKGEFYRILSDLRAGGVAIVLYSSDDEELLGLCDRVLVMHDGVISAELAGPNFNRAALVDASMGIAHGSLV